MNGDKHETGLHAMKSVWDKLSGSPLPAPAAVHSAGVPQGAAVERTTNSPAGRGT